MRRSKMNKLLLLAAAMLTVIGVNAQTIPFDRQTFLAAVQYRLKTQNDLMESGSRLNLQFEFDDRGTTWQSNLVTIPGLGISLKSGKASFGIALAYIASQESNVTF